MSSDASGLQLDDKVTFQAQALPGPYNSHIFSNSIPEAPSQLTAELDGQGYYESQGPVYIELDGVHPMEALQQESQIHFGAI